MVEPVELVNMTVRWKRWRRFLKMSAERIREAADQKVPAVLGEVVPETRVTVPIEVKSEHSTS